MTKGVRLEYLYADVVLAILINRRSKRELVNFYKIVHKIALPYIKDLLPQQQQKQQRPFATNV